MTIGIEGSADAAGVDIDDTGVAVQIPPEAHPETLAYDIVVRGPPTETPENPATYLFMIFSPRLALPFGLIYSIKSVS